LQQQLSHVRSSARGATPGIDTVAFSLVIAAVAVSFLYFGREILVPLALATLLSFVLWPVIQLLRKAKAGRILSVLIAVLLSIAGLVGLGTVMTLQVVDLASELPRYEANLRDKVRALKGASMPSRAMEKAADTIHGLEEELKKDDSSASASAGDRKIDPLHTTKTSPTGNSSNPVFVEFREQTPSVLKTYQDIIKPVLAPMTTLALVILFLVFILMQREDLRDRLLRLAGSGDLQRSTMAMNDAGDRLSRLFVIQLALNTSFGIVIGLGLWIIGVPNPVLWGILAALMRFVPYIGSVVAAVFPIALAAAVDPSWTMVFATAAMFLVAELLAGQVLEPMLYGQHTGLSPVAVVVSALFWTLLWGPVGLLLATPLTVCLVVLGKHVPALEFLAVVLGDEPALAPEQRLYQRLLAADAGEASALAEEELKSPGLTDYYDRIAMKALMLAHLDAARGRLTGDAQNELLSTVLDVTTDLADYTLESTPLDHGVSANVPVPSSSVPVDMLPGQTPVVSPVLCVPARTALDEAAAHMLCQLLTKHGVNAEVISRTSALKLNKDWRPVAGTVVCLSYFGTDNPFHARFLIRRLNRLAPATKVVAGFWMLSGDPAKVQAWQKSAGADFATASLADAVAICLEAARPGDKHQTETKATSEDSRALVA
jgi:predicted PurR-regulated permease PerM